MRTPLTLTASALALAFAAAPALSAPNIKGDKIDIRTWDTTAFSDGWSVDRLIGTDVRSAGGEEIGEVQNLILGPDNMVRKLVFSTGGFWNIGDKHLVVDWNQVTVAPGREYVTVPVTEETADQYGMFDDAPETVATKQRNWRATELIGDYVRLKNDVDYGYVQDIVIGTGGKLQAVVVEPDVGYGVRPGPYAYPFYGYGYGWDPGYDYYEMPYAADEVGDLDPYEWRT